MCVGGGVRWVGVLLFHCFDFKMNNTFIFIVASTWCTSIFHFTLEVKASSGFALMKLNFFQTLPSRKIGTSPPPRGRRLNCYRSAEDREAENHLKTSPETQDCDFCCFCWLGCFCWKHLFHKTFCCVSNPVLSLPLWVVLIWILIVLFNSYLSAFPGTLRWTLNPWRHEMVNTGSAAAVWLCSFSRVRWLHQLLVVCLFSPNPKPRAQFLLLTEKKTNLFYKLETPSAEPVLDLSILGFCGNMAGQHGGLRRKGPVKLKKKEKKFNFRWLHTNEKITIKYLICS